MYRPSPSKKRCGLPMLRCAVLRRSAAWKPGFVGVTRRNPLSPDRNDSKIPELCETLISALTPGKSMDSVGRFESSFGRSGTISESRRQESTCICRLGGAVLSLNYGEGCGGRGRAPGLRPVGGAFGARHTAAPLGDGTAAWPRSKERHTRRWRGAGPLPRGVRGRGQGDPLSRDLRQRRRARGRVRLRSGEARCRGRRRRLPAEPHPKGGLGCRALVPAQRPVEIDRVVLAGLCAHGKALRDAIDQLPASGRRIQPALVADIPAVRDLLADGDDRLLDGALALPRRDVSRPSDW